MYSKQEELFKKAKDYIKMVLENLRERPPPAEGNNINLYQDLGINILINILYLY